MSDFRKVMGQPYEAEPGTRVRRYEKHKKDREGYNVGFRLVHATGFASYSGTSYSNLPTEGRGGELPRAMGHEILGFRLTRRGS